MRQQLQTRRFSTLIFWAIALTAGFACGAYGDSAKSAASADADPSLGPTCQDQFMLDRRDNPATAIKNFQQCNTVRNLVTNMEYFTFWYVTLPPALQKPDGMFEKAWKTNIGMLTGRIVNFKQEHAIKVLDESIVRGLKRGKRDDLIEIWLAGHSPEALTRPAPTQQQAKPALADASQSAAAAPPVAPAAPQKPALPEKTVAPENTSAPSQAAVADKPKPTHAAAASTRPARAPSSQYRPATSDRGGSAPQQTGDAYVAAAAPAGSYETQAYYQQYFEYAAWAAAYAQPTPYPPPLYQPAGQQTGHVAPAPYAPQPAYYQPPAQNTTIAGQVSAGASGPQLIGQQIEKNVRTITQLIDENLRTVGQVLFGPGHGASATGAAAP